MTCRCGYRFALNPRERPFISDVVVFRTIGRLSDFGSRFFTYNQLYVQLYNRLLRKKRRDRIMVAVLLAFASVAGSAALAALTGSTVLAGLAAAAAAAGLLLFVRRSVFISYDLVAKTLQIYTAAYPPANMVDGTRFEKAPPNGFQGDFLQFSPEKILIVDRNDIVDMLLLNRFYIEQKVLVLSAKQYPSHVFSACCKILEAHPEVPVMLMHDASREGYAMKRRLLTDPAWPLTEANVKDLGIHPWDVDQARRTFWMPAGLSSQTLSGPIPAGVSAAEVIRKGFVVPLDALPPRKLTALISLSLISGFALLSPDLAALQIQQDGGDRTSGGCGGDFG